MGTGSGAMAGSAVLFLVLFSLPYMHALCCTKKIVSGTAAEAKELDGIYTLLNDVADDKNAACFDGCVYSREGKLGEEYCFQAGAGAQTTAGAGGQTTEGDGEQKKEGAGAQTT